jgi:hypothetical protein
MGRLAKVVLASPGNENGFWMIGVQGLLDVPSQKSGPSSQEDALSG